MLAECRSGPVETDFGVREVNRHPGDENIGLRSERRMQQGTVSPRPTASGSATASAGARTAALGTPADSSVATHCSHRQRASPLLDFGGELAVVPRPRDAPKPLVVAQLWLADGAKQRVGLRLHRR